jgi:phosphoglycolate phosphatase-like HAD superfamily hydrolase
MQLFINLEGTLLDVSSRYYAVYSELLKQSGFTPFDPSTYWSLKRVSIDDGAIASRTTNPGFVKDYLIEHQTLIENPAYLMLDRLQHNVIEQLAVWSKQHSITLLTSRNEYQALMEQLNMFEVDSYFDDVLISGVGRPAWELRKERMQSCLSDPMAAMMICDNEADLLAARALSVSSIAVANGRRTGNLLRRLSPDFVAGNLENINLHQWTKPVISHYQGAAGTSMH